MSFNTLGRFCPSEKCRVFSEVPKNFYKIDKIKPDYLHQHDFAIAAGLVSPELDILDVVDTLNTVNSLIKEKDEYNFLFNAIAIPFCLSIPDAHNDLGTQLEEHWLPLLKNEFEKQVPGAYFRATLQGNSQLKESIKISKGSGYDYFLDHCKSATVAGYYFPTALQEFDIKSQRGRVKILPKVENLSLCLSGPFEIICSLLAYPKLLFSKASYSPILCASALEHLDPRMVMLFKSYGPHLEFWLMTQMLTPSKTQVSEQWSGGVTIYKVVSKKD